MQMESVVGIILVAGLIGILVAGFIVYTPEDKQERGPSSVHISMREPLPRLAAALAADEHRCFYMQVHGVTFKNDDGTSRQKIISACSVGEAIELVPEPGNRYDSDAVKVCRENGEQLGYLPTGPSRCGKRRTGRGLSSYDP